MDHNAHVHGVLDFAISKFKMQIYYLNMKLLRVGGTQIYQL